MYTMFGYGGAGSGATCNSGVITVQPSHSYWPTFYTPQTGNGYAELSEVDEVTNCVVQYCGRLSIPYCGLFSVVPSDPYYYDLIHSCPECYTAQDCNGGQYPCVNGKCQKGSPIIIDLAGTGFSLTDAVHGVDFDLGGYLLDSGDPNM